MSYKLNLIFNLFTSSPQIGHQISIEAFAQL